MKILVFGGAGFLGSYVVDELIGRGHQVSVFDLHATPFVNDEAALITGNILDQDAVKRAVEGIDVVYNFAGLADLNDSIDKPAETVRLNVMGNLNILEACRAAGVKRFVYASSVYVFSAKGALWGFQKVLRTHRRTIWRPVRSRLHHYPLRFGLWGAGQRE